MSLEEYKEKYGLTYRCLSKMLNVSISGVYNWSNGNRIPKKKFARRIVKKTNGEVTMQDLGVLIT